MSNLTKQWRVFYRTSFHAKWKKGGLYETRDAARETAVGYRDEYGFRNTKVEAYVRGLK